MAKKPGPKVKLRVELVRWMGTGNYVFQITSDDPKPDADMAWVNALETATRINKVGVEMERVADDK